MTINTGDPVPQFIRDTAAAEIEKARARIAKAAPAVITDWHDLLQRSADRLVANAVYLKIWTAVADAVADTPDARAALNVLAGKIRYQTEELLDVDRRGRGLGATEDGIKLTAARANATAIRDMTRLQNSAVNLDRRATIARRDAQEAAARREPKTG